MFANQAAVSIANARAFAEIDRLHAQLELENTYLREEVKVRLASGHIVGGSPAFQRVLQHVELVAPSGATDKITVFDPVAHRLAHAKRESGRHRDRPAITGGTARRSRASCSRASFWARERRLHGRRARPIRAVSGR